MKQVVMGHGSWVIVRGAYCPGVSRAWSVGVVGCVTLLVLSPLLHASPAKRLGNLEYPLVLSYHQVIPDDRPLERGFPVIHVSDFESDLRWLADHAIRSLTLSEYLDAIRLRQGYGGELAEPEPPRDAVLLTVDDGYESVYTLIFPLLKKYGMHMVAFVITGRVGKENTINPHQPWLTWEECRELEDSGWVEIGSHSHAGHDTVTGLRLGLPRDGPFFVTRRYNPVSGALETDAAYYERIRQDLAAARREIEEHLGKPALALAWPFGASNRTAEAVAKEVGYAVTFTLNQESRPGTRMRLAVPQYWTRIAAALGMGAGAYGSRQDTRAGSAAGAAQSSGASGPAPPEASTTPELTTANPRGPGRADHPLPSGISGMSLRAALGALLTGAALFVIVSYILIRGSRVGSQGQHSQDPK